jgi:putative ABC transport system substrate-binding protein
MRQVERRQFLLASGALLVAPLAARAQMARVHRIGLLDTGSPRPQLWAPLYDGLRELGYVEGQNIALESRWAHGKAERLFGLAAELVALKVDVLVTTGTPPAQAAKQATRTIPIVMASAANPIATGLVASLARPGGNITGLTSLSGELSGKRLELLKELVPALTRLAVLWDLTNPANELEVRQTQAATESLGLRLQLLGVGEAREFDVAFSAMIKGRAEALIVQPSTPFLNERRRLAELALKHRLPTIFGRSDYADAGGLISYAVSFPDLFRRAAGYVDKILKGAKLGDLPIEQPTKLELVINLQTAKALGLVIPPSILFRADRLIPLT